MTHVRLEELGTVLMTKLAMPRKNDLESAFRRGHEEGLTFLDTHYRSMVLRFIKRVSSGALGVEELIDCYQEIFLQLTKVTRREDFDSEDPLKLVFTIARRKAIDALRRRGTRRPLLSLRPEILQSYGLAPSAEVDFAELIAVLCEAVDRLPRRQRLVAYAFVHLHESLKERKKYELIVHEIHKQSGEELSVSAAKSAWLKARERIRSALSEKGFNSGKRRAS